MANSFIQECARLYRKTLVEKVLGIPMIFSFFYRNLGRALARPDIREAGHKFAREILTDFYMPQSDAIFERRLTAVAASHQ